MYVISSKNLLLLLVTLFLVFFTAATTQEANDQPPKHGNKINGIEMLAVEEKLLDHSGDLSVMDYTPAQRKIPIHN
ncbi:hypothetical protein ABFS83_08G237200 [Erythranthe nasuta]